MSDDAPQRLRGDKRKGTEEGSAPRRRRQGSPEQSRARSGKPAPRHMDGGRRRPPAKRTQQSRGTAPQGQRRRPAGSAQSRPAKAQRQRNPQQHAARQAAPQRARHPQAPKRGVSPILIVGIVVVALVLSVGGFFLVRNLTTKGITVNGEKYTVARGATPRTLVEEKLVSVSPGNLLAVDGSLLEKGGGDPCFATADGHPIGVDEDIPANATVEVGNGHDTTEEFDEKEVTIEPERVDGDTSFSAYWNGSIHLLSDGEPGTMTTKTGKQSGYTVEEVTKPAVDAGYVIYSAKPEDKVIALTFDDGPWNNTTSAILDLLEQYNAKATFFVIGNQVEGHEDLLKREAQLGCQVCTHTWDHSQDNLGSLTASQQIKEVEDGYAAIAKALGEEPKHIIRAPGGNFNGDTITNLWDIVDAEIGWDVDTEDWKAPGSDAILNMIMSASSGNVILMHDGGGDRPQTVEALRQALPQLIEQGYKFVTIDELLAYGLPKSDGRIPSTTDTGASSTTSGYSTTSSDSTSSTQDSYTSDSSSGSSGQTSSTTSDGYSQTGTTTSDDETTSSYSYTTDSESTSSTDSDTTL